MAGPRAPVAKAALPALVDAFADGVESSLLADDAAGALLRDGGRALRGVVRNEPGSADLLVARRISRAGQVGQIMVEPGRFVASVEDARGLWTVAGTLPVLDDSASAALVETVGAEAGRIGALLSGDLPEDTFASVRLAASAGEALPGPLLTRFKQRFGGDIIDGIGYNQGMHIFVWDSPGRRPPATHGKGGPG